MKPTGGVLNLGSSAMALPSRPAPALAPPAAAAAALPAPVPSADEAPTTAALAVPLHAAPTTAALAVPLHAVECFKAVAVVNGRMLSIFDGNTEYALNRVCQTLPHSGLWVCPSIFSLFVHAAQLPSQSGEHAPARQPNEACSL